MGRPDRKSKGLQGFGRGQDPKSRAGGSLCLAEPAFRDRNAAFDRAATLQVPPVHQPILLFPCGAPSTFSRSLPSDLQHIRGARQSQSARAKPAASPVATYLVPRRPAQPPAPCIAAARHAPLSALPRLPTPWQGTRSATDASLSILRPTGKTRALSAARSYLPRSGLPALRTGAGAHGIPPAPDSRLHRRPTWRCSN